MEISEGRMCHREGMWTKCAVLLFHGAASFPSALGMKSDEDIGFLTPTALHINSREARRNGRC